MDTDLMLTLGIGLMILTVPSLLSAWVDGRVPRLGSLMVLASASLIVAAMVNRPTGYRFEEIPQVMLGVVARVWN
jgi:hypothetical protein